MTTKRPEMTDRELWRSLATGRDGLASERAPGPVSDTDLAAWLEGRLTEFQAERIDRAMAADPALRQTALELSEVLGKPLPTPPDRLIVRAKALVGFEAEHAAPRGFAGPLASLFPNGFRAGPQRAAMASLAVVIAVAGFMLGGGLGESYAKQRGQARHDALSEFGELFRDGGI
jgi:anti-sigma factor RsiW